MSKINVKLSKEMKEKQKSNQVDKFYETIKKKLKEDLKDYKYALKNALVAKEYGEVLKLSNFIELTEDMIEDIYWMWKDQK